MKQKIFTTLFALGVSIIGGAQKQQLSLNEAFSLALKNNKKLQISLIENKKSAEAIKEYKSFLQPTINASASYIAYAEKPVIFLRDETSGRKVNGVKVGGTNSFSGAVTGSYPILQPIIYDKIRLAGISAQLQKEKHEDFVSSLLLEVAQTYLMIQFYKEQITLFQQSLVRNEQALTDSRMFLLQGKGLKTDTLRNYIDVQNLKASISAVENQITIQALNLKQLIGVDESLDIELIDQLSDMTDAPFSLHSDTLKVIALANRPDVRAKELQIDYSKSELKMITSEFKPSLHLFAQYQLQAQSDKLNVWNYNVPRTSFAGLQLNVPIYSGKRIRYKTEQSKYSVEQTKLSLEDLKQNVSKEINSLLASLKESYTQKDIQEKNLEAAQVNYAMIKDRYKYGLSNRLELIDAELSFTKAKISQLHSIYIIKTIELQLKKALGMLK